MRRGLTVFSPGGRLRGGCVSKDDQEFWTSDEVPLGYPNGLSTRQLEDSEKVCPGAIDLRIIDYKQKWIH